MRYMKKPHYVEAVWFIGLTSEGDPYFDVSGGMPQWLIDAVSGPEGQVGSIWVDHDEINAKATLVTACEISGIVTKVGIPSAHWVVNDDGRISMWDDGLFRSLYDQTVDPLLAQAAKDGERSLLLDMQSECIQLRVALAQARDQFAFYGAEHITKAEHFEHKARNAFDRGDVIVSDNRAEDAVASRVKAKVNEEFAAMCQKAIDCRPAARVPAPEGETGGDFLARLGMDGMLWAEEFVRQFAEKGIGYDGIGYGSSDIYGWFANAIMAGYDRGREQGWKEDAPYGHSRADCPNLNALQERGTEALKNAAAPNTFTIGNGFATVGDSDGDDGA